MSMLALCLLTVSWVRIGSAWLLISWSLPFPFGYCRTLTLVILRLLTLSCTSTGPHCVWATDPLTVLVVGALVADPEGFDPEMLEPEEPKEPELPETPELLVS